MARRRRARVVRTLLAALTGAVLLVIACVVAVGPTAQAAALGTGATRSTAVAAAAPSKPCVVSINATKCQSTNPNLTIDLVNTGDTSACTFTDSIVWGDGSAAQQLKFKGYPQSGDYLLAKHTYHATQTRTYSVTATPVSITGNCINSLGSYAFTLNVTAAGLAPGSFPPPLGTGGNGAGCNCVTYVRQLLKAAKGTGSVSNPLPGTGQPGANAYGGGWLSAHDSDWVEIHPVTRGGQTEIYTAGRPLIMVWAAHSHGADAGTSGPGLGHIALVVNQWSHDAGLTGSDWIGPIYMSNGPGKPWTWHIQVVQSDWYPECNGTTVTSSFTKDWFGTPNNNESGTSYKDWTNLNGITFYKWVGPL